MSGHPTGRKSPRRSRRLGGRGSPIAVTLAASASLLLALWAAPAHSHTDGRADAPASCAVCHSAHHAPTTSSAPTLVVPPDPGTELVPPASSGVRELPGRLPSHRPRAPPA